MVVMVLRCHRGVTQSHASHPSHPCGWFVLGMGETESQWGSPGYRVPPCFALDRGWMQPPKLLSPPCPCWDSTKQEIDVKTGFSHHL